MIKLSRERERAEIRAIIQQKTHHGQFLLGLVSPRFLPVGNVQQQKGIRFSIKGWSDKRILEANAGNSTER